MGRILGLAKATGFDKNGSLTACILLRIRRQQRTESNKRLSVNFWRTKLLLIYYSSVSHLIIIVNIFLISPKVGSREWTLEGHGRVQCMPSTTSTLFACSQTPGFQNLLPSQIELVAHISHHVYIAQLHWDLACIGVLLVVLLYWLACTHSFNHLVIHGILETTCSCFGYVSRSFCSSEHTAAVVSCCALQSRGRSWSHARFLCGGLRKRE